MIRFEEYFKRVLTYKNIDVFDTNHSVARFYERVSDNIGLYTNLLKKGIDRLINDGRQSINDRYIFISKKYGFGIQIDYRQDRMTGKFACYSATTLSDNEMNFVTKNDKKLFLENIIKTGNDKRLLNEGFYTYDLIDNDDLKEELEYIGYSKFIEAGKIYTDFELLEVINA